jgi:hypothetical protein
MGIFSRIFIASPEELAEMQRDVRAYLERNSRELELELLRRKEQQQLTMRVLNPPQITKEGSR